MSAAHPVWVGDQVRGVVVAEETGNAVLAERNRAFERLFNIVLAVLLVGSLALTAYATWLSSRIRRLRDDAERAIDEQGRVRGALASSDAGDEIGDLSRSFSSVLARLSEYASYQEKMASRLSHELRTPIAVVRTSLDNLKATPLPDDARVYIARAQEGLDAAHADPDAHDRGRAARAEPVRRRARALRPRAGRRAAASTATASRTRGADRARRARRSAIVVDGAPDLVAQMLDKLRRQRRRVRRRRRDRRARRARRTAAVRLSVANDGPPLPEGMAGRLFESMVSVRAGGESGAPHLGLGLYIVRVIAQFHGGTRAGGQQPDGTGVVVVVTLPRASS